MSSALFFGKVGFYKTPVTKGILGSVLLTSCALHVPVLANYRHLFLYSMTDLFHRYKMWRIISSKLAFLDTKDLVCGCLLLYYFRVFERRFGSHKFASYLLATFTVSTLIEITLVSSLRYFDIANIQYLSSGPFSIIFSLFINYCLDIPRVTQTHLLGIPITSKSLAYLIGFQAMVTSHGTMICSMSGLIAGMICRWNVFNICDVIRIPNCIASWTSKLLSWLLESTPPSDNHVQLGATLDIQRQQNIELMEQQMMFSRLQEMNASNDLNFYTSRQNDLNSPINQNVSGISGDTVGNVSVNEEQVQTLVEMGFNRQNVVRALMRSNNDANLATTILLNESS